MAVPAGPWEGGRLSQTGRMPVPCARTKPGEPLAVPDVEGAIPIVFLSSAFGLGVWSNVPIPGLAALARTAPPDVRVWLGVTPSLPGEAGASAWPVHYQADGLPAGTEPTLCVWRAPDGTYFRF